MLSFYLHLKYSHGPVNCGAMFLDEPLCKHHGVSLHKARWYSLLLQLHVLDFYGTGRTSKLVYTSITTNTWVMYGIRTSGQARLPWPWHYWLYDMTLWGLGLHLLIVVMSFLVDHILLWLYSASSLWYLILKIGMVLGKTSCETTFLIH